jgi:hypothetical protein
LAPAALLFAGGGSPDLADGEATTFLAVGGMLCVPTLALCTWVGRRWGAPRAGPLRLLLRDLFTAGPV